MMDRTTSWSGVPPRRSATYDIAGDQDRGTDQLDHFTRLDALRESRPQ
jgi:hypothetical protein